jgi:V/A-type H+-transporting ATPase subunit E
MGHQELIESLRKDADRKVSNIRNDAEAEINNIRAELIKKIDLLRDACTKKQEASLRELKEQIGSEAYKKVREIRLTAEKNVSDRFFHIALSCLNRLRSENYAQIFSLLADELPSLQWTEVRVSPEDTDMAREHFTGSNISGDRSITGGFEVERGDGTIRVINTFEKRLERAWADMLPMIIRDVYR